MYTWCKSVRGQENGFSNSDNFNSWKVESNGSFTLPETDSGTDSDSDSCPIQK